MRRTLFFAAPFLISLAAFKFVPNLKENVFFHGLRFVAERSVLVSCKGDFSCEESMRGFLDSCAAGALNLDRELFQIVDQNKLVSCLQKGFVTHSCQGEKRCLATIDQYFQKCFELAYPTPEALKDPLKGQEFGDCLKERQFLVNVR